MGYIMLQYERPTDVRNWNAYNGMVKGWIDRLLSLPGAVSLMAYRTADGSSPGIIGMLEFRSLDDAKSAASSEKKAKAILASYDPSVLMRRWSSLSARHTRRHQSGLRYHQLE